MAFSVSVIVPVYNAAAYVTQAIESAASLDDVEEVLVIDDGSTDDSLSVCDRLAGKYPKVRLLRHADRSNHGVSATRNLGIVNARCKFISFLDADDYYLPTRFRCTKAVFDSDDLADGVYEAAQLQGYYEKGSSNLYSINEAIEPASLFYWLFNGQKGCFCVDGITVRKRLLDSCGYFLEYMRMHEDTELWFRLAYHGRLVAGELNEPVAIIRRHEANAIYLRTHQTTRELFRIVRNYYKDRDVGYRERREMISRYWRSQSTRFKSNLLRRLGFYLPYWLESFYLRVFVYGRGATALLALMVPS